MQSNTHVTQSFRSDARPLVRICVKIAVFGSPLLVAAGALGQYRADRFPSYQDLLLAALVPIVVAVGIGALFYFAIHSFKIQVLAEGLRCYDLVGRYRTVTWSEIGAVQRVTTCGLPYLYIRAPGFTQPVTLPLWLVDMPNFVSAVEARAGQHNMLVKALREAT